MQCIQTLVIREKHDEQHKSQIFREKGALGCSAHRQVALLTAGTRQRTSSDDTRQYKSRLQLHTPYNTNPTSADSPPLISSRTAGVPLGPPPPLRCPAETVAYHRRSQSLSQQLLEFYSNSLLLVRHLAWPRVSGMRI